MIAPRLPQIVRILELDERDVLLDDLSVPLFMKFSAFRFSAVGYLLFRQFTPIFVVQLL